MWDGKKGAELPGCLIDIREFKTHTHLPIIPDSYVNWLICCFLLFFYFFIFLPLEDCCIFVQWSGWLTKQSKSKNLFWISFCVLSKCELSICLSSPTICTLLLNYILNLRRLAALNWWGWFQTQRRSRFVPGGNVHTNSFTNANKLQRPWVHSINSQRIRWVLNLIIALLKPQRSRHAYWS